jgi:ligand-binding sensor domain-containing protein
LRAIAQTPDGRYWIGSYAKGLAWFSWAPRLFGDVAGAPSASITALEANPDGSLWVGTAGAGVWRYQPTTGAWTKLNGVPGARVFKLYVETRFGARQLYVATEGGLAVYTE